MPRRGYILACNGYIPDQNYMMAVKLDSDANIEWSKEIALESGEGGEYLIKPVRDDGYLLLGERRLIRLNRQGEIDWQYVAGEAPDYFRTGLISFISTPDNGVIVVGYYMTLDQETWQQGLMIKINENGEREWQKLIGTDWRTYLYQIESTGNGNYVMAGTSGSETNQELTLTKIDNEGNTLSAQTYPAGGLTLSVNWRSPQTTVLLLPDLKWAILTLRRPASQGYQVMDQQPGTGFSHGIISRRAQPA